MEVKALGGWQRKRGSEVCNYGYQLWYHTYTHHKPYHTHTHTHTNPKVLSYGRGQLESEGGLVKGSGINKEKKRKEKKTKPEQGLGDMEVQGPAAHTKAP